MRRIFYESRQILCPHPKKGMGESDAMANKIRRNSLGTYEIAQRIREHYAKTTVGLVFFDLSILRGPSSKFTWNKSSPPRRRRGRGVARQREKETVAVAGQAAVKLMVHCFAGTAGSLETGAD
jgi:hypothetical protein